jgi:hypothetical protein
MAQIPRFPFLATAYLGEISSYSLEKWNFSVHNIPKVGPFSFLARAGLPRMTDSGYHEVSCCQALALGPSKRASIPTGYEIAS